MNSTQREWRHARLTLAVLVLTIRCAAASAEVVTDGLVVHLDAARQIEAGGASAANTKWQNLAAASDASRGSVAELRVRARPAAGLATALRAIRTRYVSTVASPTSKGRWTSNYPR